MLKKNIFKFLTYLIVGFYFSLSTLSGGHPPAGGVTSNTPQTTPLNKEDFTGQADTTHSDTAVKFHYPKLDSFLNLLKTAKHDTTKIKILNKLVKKLQDNNPKQALQYANQALDLCDKLPYSSGEGQGVRWMSLRAIAYNKIGIIYKDLGNYSLSLENYLNALNIYEAQNDSEGMAVSYNGIGIIYRHQGQYPRALKYYFKALRIFEKIKMENPDNRWNQESLASTYIAVGIIYKIRNELKRALNYYLAALEICNKIKNKTGMIAIIYGNIASVYYDQGKIKKSLELDMKSLTIYQEIGDRDGMAVSYNNIGETYTELAKADTTPGRQEKFEQALDYQHKALEIEKELGNKYYITFSLANIGNIYIEQDKPKTSLPWFKQSAAIAEEINAKPEMRDAYFGLYKAYKKLNNLSKALTYHEKYDIVKYSIHNEEISKAIGKQEGIHEIDIKNIKRAYKQKEEERIAAEEKKRSDTRQHLGIGSVLLLLFFLIFFFTFRRLATIIPFVVVEVILFITFLLFFEYVLMLLDPIIEEFSGGLPALKLAYTSIVAGVIFPFHRFFEKKIKQRIYKAKKEKVERKRNPDSIGVEKRHR